MGKNDGLPNAAIKLVGIMLRFVILSAVTVCIVMLSVIVLWCMLNFVMLSDAMVCIVLLTTECHCALFSC
jgi:hypothetical protein